MAERIDDDARFGVENIWIIDPVRRRAWRIMSGERKAAAGLTLTTADGELTLPLGEVFAAIDAIE